MFFSARDNVVYSGQSDRPLVRKDKIPVGDSLGGYLQRQGCSSPFALRYAHLLDYSHTDSIRDAAGKHTHWERVTYHTRTEATLHRDLLSAYCSLSTDSVSFDRQAIHVSAIDYCEYANSMPFRITLSDGKVFSDIFYVKEADASRIYGLELERLLSDTPLSFVFQADTLVERHIPGRFADDYLLDAGDFSIEQKRKAARAFVAFNAACFVRLLGDMRSYNFVYNEAAEGRSGFRAIDFDQQCHEGFLLLYFPHFYAENRLLVDWVSALLSPEETRQAERTMLMSMRKSAAKHRPRLNDLLQILSGEELSERYKLLQLRNALGQYHGDPSFEQCNSMGELLLRQLVSSGLC